MGISDLMYQILFLYRYEARFSSLFPIYSVKCPYIYSQAHYSFIFLAFQYCYSCRVFDSDCRSSSYGNSNSAVIYVTLSAACTFLHLFFPTSRSWTSGGRCTKVGNKAFLIINIFLRLLTCTCMFQHYKGD